MTDGSEWSRVARERRRAFKAEGMNSRLAASIVRVERAVQKHFAKFIGRETAEKVRLVYIEGDPNPIKLLLDNCHLTDQQRQTIDPLSSSFALNLL